MTTYYLILQYMPKRRHKPISCWFSQWWVNQDPSDCSGSLIEQMSSRLSHICDMTIDECWDVFVWFPPLLIFVGISQQWAIFEYNSKYGMLRSLSYSSYYDIIIGGNILGTLAKFPKNAYFPEINKKRP